MSKIFLPSFQSSAGLAIFLFLSYFCFGTFGTLGTFSLPLIHPNQTGETLTRDYRVLSMSYACPMHVLCLCLSQHLLLSPFHSYTYTKKAQTSSCLFTSRGLRIALKVKQTTGNLRRYDKPPAMIRQGGVYSHTHRHLLVTLFLTFNSESCEVPTCQLQSVNKRYFNTFESL